MHNTRDCRKYDGGTGSTQMNRHDDKNHSNQREREGANYAQIIHKEVKKAFRMQSHNRKKHHGNDSDSNSDSYYNLWSHRSDNTGELHMCKKRKLNVSVNDYTYPNPSTIQHNKIELNDNFNSE
jgi:hypothetical protein